MSGHTLGNRKAFKIESKTIIYRDHNGNPVNIAAFVLADDKRVVGRFAKFEDALLDAAAPTMYLYVASKADSGDSEALKIIQEINNAS